MTRTLIEHLDAALAAVPLEHGEPALPLRPATALQYWPLARHYSRTLFAKARKFAPIGQAPATKSGPNPIAGLWAEGEISAMMHPGTMLTSFLYQPEALRAFLESAKSPCFGRVSEFGRVVTLELLARAI
jgi:hypothetical protein